MFTILCLLFGLTDAPRYDIDELEKMYGEDEDMDDMDIEELDDWDDEEEMTSKQRRNCIIRYICYFILSELLSAVFVYKISNGLDLFGTIVWSLPLAVLLTTIAIFIEGLYTT